MKVTVLAENTSENAALPCEHGLSLWIEAQEKNILFDMGQGALFAENAERLGIDIRQADFAVLSHGHYDHGGGLATLFTLHPQCPVYISPHAFGEFRNGQGDFIGLDRSLKEGHPFLPTYDILSITPSITLFPSLALSLSPPREAFGLTVTEGDSYCADPFYHEQYLLVREENKKVLFSGCSHNGVYQIVTTLQPDVLVGGLHLSKLDPQNPVHRLELEKTAQGLKGRKSLYYTGHCTGESQFQFLKSYLGENLLQIKTGTIFHL